MKIFDGLNKAGSFKLDGDMEIIGELKLNGSDSALELYSDKSFNTDQQNDIFGKFLDKSKVSLLNCITKMGPGCGVRGGDVYYNSIVFPHFVVFGNEHVGSTDQCISRLSFSVDDAASIFHDLDSFGMVLKPKKYLELISEDGDEKQSIKIGTDPLMFYFSGAHEIFSVDTIIGKISIVNGISYKFPGPEGIYLKNTNRIEIEFPNKQTLEESVDHVHDLLRFLEIVAGRPQNITELKFLRTDSENESSIYDVYWCMPPKRAVESESPNPHPSGVLMQEFTKKGEFGTVLAEWIKKNDSWKNARVRFSTAFGFQRGYYIDRLVGAANMFDILPSSACPADVRLNADILLAKNSARQIFTSLEDSPERNSILGALGRLGKATLKQKVRQRAQIVIPALGSLFSELEFVLLQAVDCRNYYVHGSHGKFNYGKNNSQVTFFIQTLEFVFATSDLIECGWDIDAWRRQGAMRSHPFAEYIDIFSWELEKLKKVIEIGK